MCRLSLFFSFLLLLTGSQFSCCFPNLPREWSSGKMTLRILISICFGLLGVYLAYKRLFFWSTNFLDEAFFIFDNCFLPFWFCFTLTKLSECSSLVTKSAVLTKNTEYTSGKILTQFDNLTKKRKIAEITLIKLHIILPTNSKEPAVEKNFNLNGI